MIDGDERAELLHQVFDDDGVMGHAAFCLRIWAINTSSRDGVMILACKPSGVKRASVNRWRLAPASSTASTPGRARSSCLVARRSYPTTSHVVSGRFFF